MKKIILTIAAVSAISFVNAQETRLGVKGGLNLATLTNIPDQFDSSMKAGFHVGGFAEIMIDEKFAVQPEILYSTQGAKVSSSGAGITNKSDLTLSYLNVPIMAKYFLNEKFSLEAGPQMGFLLSAKSKSETSGGGISESSNDDVKDQFKSTDFGVNFGLGYNFTEDVFAGIRYNLGLSQTQKELGDGEKASKNSVFQFSLGYRF